MKEAHGTAPSTARLIILSGWSLVEDVVYIGLGLLLTASALALLFTGFKTFVVSVAAHAVGAQVVGLLDQILLILLVVELLYTVQVSFREHSLVAEPFLVVALIAVIRRILVVTAETAHLPETSNAVFQHAIIELAMLTVMVLVLVASLIAMQKQVKLPSVNAGEKTEPASPEAKSA